MDNNPNLFQKMIVLWKKYFLIQFYQKLYKIKITKNYLKINKFYFHMNKKNQKM